MADPSEGGGSERSKEAPGGAADEVSAGQETPPRVPDPRVNASDSDLPTTLKPVLQHQGIGLLGLDSTDAADEKEQEEEEEEPLPPLRQRIMAVMDGKVVQTIMTFLTIFALYGDDLRLRFFFAAHDSSFYALYILVFVLFAGELTIFTICKDEYRYSFFFCLDLIASLSLIIDIKWIMDAIGTLFEGGDSAAGGQGSVARAGRASRAGTRAGRIVRLIRLVRLLRVVNIAKLFSREEKSQLDTIQEEQRKGQDKREEEKSKRVEASRLGAVLSEQTTRTVIMGVLCMMLVLPMIEVAEQNRAPSFGLENLFWHGRSQCSGYKEFVQAGHYNDIPLQCAPVVPLNESSLTWIQEEGFSHMLYAYTQASRFYDNIREQDLRRPVLYISVPDALRGGKLRPIDYIISKRCGPSDRAIKYPFSGYEEDFVLNGGWIPECRQALAEGKCCWQRHPYCGMNKDSRCPWREAEMDANVFTPVTTCNNFSSCTHLTAYAKILNRYKSEIEAEYNMLQTTFIVFLLAVGAMSFSKDTQQLVIAPIEKMVNIVKQLADDPLSKPEVIEEEEIELKTKANSQLETSMLENTILKIGGLLQVGFGEAGAQIIGKNMSSQEGELNIMLPGRKIIGIFGFCFIRDFMDATECLLEEVMVFVNKIARIVHICVHEWGGAANKNIGDSFLLTWMVSDNEEQKKLLREGSEENPKMQELADKALVAFIKVIADLRRASDLRAYTSHPKIQQKFLNNYEVKMGFGLHCGWAIEGAIGSEHKIDASYLSPHVNTCARFMLATMQYAVDIILSDTVFVLLSTKAKDRCRKLDVVLVKGSAAPIGIHTLDLNNETVPAPEGHQPGEVITTGEITKEALFSKGVKTMFEADLDVLSLQANLSSDFYNQWRQAFHLYINGAWSLAYDQLQKCSDMRNQQGQGSHDGPSECLLAYIGSLEYTAPENWEGCRRLSTR